MKALCKPLSRNIRNVHDWMTDNRPLVQGEDDFILHVNDLVSTKKRSEQINQQGNRIDKVIESCASRWPRLNVRFQFIAVKLISVHRKSRLTSFRFSSKPRKSVRRQKTLLFIIFQMNVSQLPVKSCWHPLRSASCSSLYSCYS